jgi:hypothetical protein
MLDAFGSDNPGDYIGGFPSHPHRGFETVTYMIAGRMRHRDSAGHEGLLANGGVQWMTAGRGLVHSELPEQEEGLMEGFQLWLNLPAKDKMREPWYRDIQSEEIPEFVTPAGVHVRVIAGESHGIAGAVQREHTEPLYLDNAPWGEGGLCGAEAAARRYFKRSARNLEPAQAVWLASMLNNPGAALEKWQRDGRIDGERAKWVAEGLRGLTRGQRESLLRNLAAARFAPPP